MKIHNIFLSLILVLTGLFTNATETDTGNCSKQLLSSNNMDLVGADLNHILQVDPLGTIDKKVHGKGISGWKKSAQISLFIFKYFRIMAKIRKLKDQSLLDASSVEGIARSSALLGITEKEFISYYSAAMRIKTLSTPDIDLEAIQNEGKKLIELLLEAPIQNINQIKSSEKIYLVLFSGPMCTWCDYVKPTFALLSQFMPSNVVVAHSEDREFGKSEGIRFFPLLMVYGPKGKVLSQAYFSDTKKLWHRMQKLIEEAEVANGSLVINKKGDQIVSVSKFEEDVLNLLD